MTTENQAATGDSGGEGGKAPPVTPPTTPTTPKVELKDGATFLDGKKVVLESDLIAAKNSLEGKLTQQQTAHEAAIDAAKLEASTAQDTIAQLNARIKETEEARQAGTVSDEDAVKVKQELETAKGSIVTLTVDANRALELRRANLVLQYGVTPDTIKDKDMVALDSFEEALKAVSTARGGGVGPYAIGGGSGEAAPQTDIERAAKILETTPVRGVRNAEP